MPGIDVLAVQDFAMLRQQRAGLLTHSAAVNRAGEPTWSVLYRAADVNLVALFAPENGFDGRAPSSTGFTDTIHRPTGLPLHSLHARPPTNEMLAGIDVMVVDLQDIGTRSYTFAAAMRDAMEACFQQGKTVVVLDRPNPLGGLKVDGPPVDPEWRSYVSALPVPYVHGLTMGELARLALDTEGLLDLTEDQRRDAHLIVVPMRGWRRDMRWTDTGLAWRQTSPYVADFAAVEGYPITGLGCILGGFTHGVGKEHPFRGLAFPGITADVLISNLQALRISGLGFRKVEPIDDQGRKREGVLIDITDWDALRPTELSLHLMRLACQWNDTNPFARATQSEQQRFNRHVGSTRWWNALVREGRRVDVSDFVNEWSREAAEFQQRTRRLWLYPAPDHQAGVPGSELVASTPR